MSDHLDKSTSLEEFLEFQQINGESCNTTTISVFASKEYFKKNINNFENLANDFAKKSKCIIIYIFYINEQDNDSIGYTDILINSNGKIFINHYIEEE